jgi:hypothetical protein
MKNKRIFVPIVFAALIAAPCLAAKTAAVSNLSAITFLKTDMGVQITIVVNGDFSNDVFRLTEPERLVMDLTPVDKVSVAPQVDVNAGGVLRVRTGQFKPRVARLAFDLETPAIGYKIERIAEGLKITFREEGESKAPQPAERVAQPVVKTEPPAEVKTEAKEETKPAPVTPPQIVAPPPAVSPAVPAEGPSFFVQIAGGIGTFLQPESTFTRTFPINGRNGTADEIFKMKMNTPASLSVGLNVRLLDIPAKVGLAFEYWNFKSDGTFRFSVPHPFLEDTVRTLSAANQFRSYFASVSAYSIFHLFSSGALQVMAGPEIGYATGKFKLLDTIDIADSAPYTEAELSIRSLTYKDRTVSSFWAGLRIGIEYAFSEHLAGVLNLRGVYLSPEIGELSNKLVLSQVQAMIGVQYSF